MKQALVVGTMFGAGVGGMLLVSRLRPSIFQRGNRSTSSSRITCAKAQKGSAITTGPPKVIDSHLHIWASAAEAASKFPYADGKTPIDSLIDRATPTALLEQMKDAHVDGALIIQPIDHKFDHSYVAAAIKEYPDKFKGMWLHDPSMNSELALSQLESYVSQGFVGVRFNPYLWPEGADMSGPGGAGLAVYKRCGDLGLPVGVMCFKGLHLHYDDITRLIDASPETQMVLDHFAFTSLDPAGDKAFEQLLSLAKHKNVAVKISAIFRVAKDQPSSGWPYPYEGVYTKRFLPLLETFGAHRLMFGTDFPFVLNEGGYKQAVELVSSWARSDEERTAIMSGTVQQLFGSWGIS
eukprot:gene6095-2692_t